MAASPKPSLSAGDLAAIDGQLAATDRLLEQNYPGDDGSRQPVHTVYVPADRFTPSFTAEWGAEAMAAASAVAAAVVAGSAPPFIGIRFKCFEAATRARGLRTLDLFVSGLAAAGELPEGLVLTLPKVTTMAQVKAMDYAVSRLEEVHSLPAGRLRFEVQVETPQLILGPEGTSPVAQLPHAVPGRISGLHYGTYDYSASLHISAEY